VHSFTNYSFFYPQDITVGPDGALWFTSEYDGYQTGRITTAGKVTTIYVSIAPPEVITAGPDGALWFIDDITNSIGRITI
jgi:virginiamycin B lyase